jgi:dTDP-4-dehydrorhamnose reductase
MKQIIVLGANGMLGQMAVRYFSNFAATVPVTLRFTTKGLISLRDFFQAYRECIIINCIGSIPQKSSSEFGLYETNFAIPTYLTSCLSQGQHLIQPTTDCVFDGQIPPGSFYPKDSERTPLDSYGASKMLAELALEGRPRTTLIRVSIIGTDSISKSPRGLLGWFLSQPQGTFVTGYTNHYWNGITTLEWCKQVHKMISEGLPTIDNLIQLGTIESQSKYQVLCQAKEVFSVQCEVRPGLAERQLNRCLVPEIVVKPLIEQLRELQSLTRTA